MTPVVSSVVFFSADPEGLARLLLVLGVPLEPEEHEDEVPHWAGELDEVHVAVYPGETDAPAPGLREGGSTFVGLYVDDLDACECAVEEAGFEVLQHHVTRPWGCRFIVAAPDGRALEVNQRAHCAGGAEGRQA